MAAPRARPKGGARQAKRVKQSISPRRLQYANEPDSKLELLTSRQVADILGISVKLLADWRYRGKHLPFYSAGNLVRYDWADVEAFLVKHRREIDPDHELTPSEAKALARNLKAAREVLAASPKLSVAAFMRRGGVGG